MAKTYDDYLKAAHAMQSGVAFKMHTDPSETQPKHLRVGVNSAMVEQSAIAKLLIDKGIITVDEYTNAIAEAMEAEVERYKAYFKDRGTNVDLA